MPALGRLMPQLTKVDLTDCEPSLFDESFAGALAKGTLLTELDLYSCGIGSQECEFLAPALSQLVYLEKLNLGANHIGDKGALHLGVAMPSLAKLRQLSVFNYPSDTIRIGVEGVTALVAGLSDNAGLQKFDLSHHAIGDTGAEILAASMPGWRRLKKLDIIGNNIGDQGASAVAGCLHQCVRLRELSIGNRIGDSGAIAIAKAIPHMPKSTIFRYNCIDLTDNSIGRKGASALEDAADYTHLHLNGNPCKERYIVK
ncbi:hypothetical protein KIPB_007225 [Kipferlia bialata]|uniref:Uncharacterized protein n=1 Tax=Kipferlia bialata TaxID=797122 RepID=A0A391NQ52_9EUKA|nr:hypothetical protein KIPB_007225 [Kipferlia bialata]|eukprot:g7225.t1